MGISSKVSFIGQVQTAKKNNLYSQMAQVLVGHDETGSIREFTDDGTITGNPMRLVYFVNYSRLLSKDEFKKGSYNLQLGTHNLYTTPFMHLDAYTDTNGGTNYFTNSPAGEYSLLYNTASVVHGLLYHQAGIAVLSSSVFPDNVKMNAATNTQTSMFSIKTIDENATAFRYRWYNNAFNNTIELNAKNYYCRIAHNEFNYSSNKTYLSASKIRVKNVPEDEPVAYITGVGLYSSDNELLATAKLSEPLKSTPSTDLTLRVRLDY